MDTTVVKGNPRVCGVCEVSTAVCGPLFTLKCECVFHAYCLVGDGPCPTCGQPRGVWDQILLRMLYNLGGDGDRKGKDDRRACVPPSQPHTQMQPETTTARVRCQNMCHLASFDMLCGTCWGRIHKPECTVQDPKGCRCTEDTIPDCGLCGSVMRWKLDVYALDCGCSFHRECLFDHLKHYKTLECPKCAERLTLFDTMHLCFLSV